MTSSLFRAAFTVTATAVLAVALTAPVAHADHDNNTLIPNNSRLNNSLVDNVYTIQHQAGCTNDVNLNPQLNQAAQWHTDDLMNNRALDSDIDIGTDGST
ncbi:MAG: CAP domain-containing protein, partial [Mycobacterium sp.]